MALAAAPDTLRSASVDPSEIAKFSAIADEWWDPNGKFKPLHVFNPVRLGFIRDTVCAHRGLDPHAKRPFEGLRLLDIGCGGGLVSEPMARLGADVVGLDAAERNVKTALTHAQSVGLAIDYRHGAVEQLAEAGDAPFDVILNLEVVEHVADVDAFLKASAVMLAPGGVMIIATINRTPKAFALAIVGAEYVLGWLPRGTHQFDKLVRPQDIRRALAPPLAVDGPVGVSFNPLLDRWSLSRDAAVNYLMTATRPPSV